MINPKTEREVVTLIWLIRNSDLDLRETFLLYDSEYFLEGHNGFEVKRNSGQNFGDLYKKEQKEKEGEEKLVSNDWNSMGTTVPTFLIFNVKNSSENN